MKYPTTRLVFDRKKTATKKVPALVQVEVLLSGKKKYITTGVKVYKDQWNDKLHVCNTDEADTLNARITQTKKAIDEYIQSVAQSGSEWDWDAFARFLQSSSKKSETFIEYLTRRIGERTDIRESTRKNHTKLVTSLKEYGRIVTFDELTRPNVSDYYEWLLGRDISKIGSDGLICTKKASMATSWGYMKLLRTYIHDAIRHEVIDKDPSIGIKVKRNDTSNVKWLTEDELDRIENARMPSGSLVRVRDLFIFMCYSGLAYSDAMDFRKGKIEEEDGMKFIRGRRIKTGEEYIVLMLPKVEAILEKYDYNLPHYSNQQLNKRIKDVMKVVGIDKNTSSHFARHSCAMYLLNNGIRIETVAKVLGHSSTRITQAVYASILKKTVGEEMKKLIKE